MTWAARPSLPALHRVTATEMSTILDRVAALGHVGESFATASTTGAAESFHITHTFTAVAGLRYHVEFDGAWQDATAGGIGTFRIRWAAGASVTSAGTLLRVMTQVMARNASNTPIAMMASFVPGAGQTTVGISVQGTAATNLNWGSGTVVARLAVECIGE